MTGSVGDAAAATLTALAAAGAERVAWLLALPVAGAVILLVGGRRTDRWGHVVGVVMPAAAPPMGWPSSSRCSTTRPASAAGN